MARNSGTTILPLLHCNKQLVPPARPFLRAAEPSGINEKSPPLQSTDITSIYATAF